MEKIVGVEKMIYDFEKTAEECGMTYKQNLGVFQFYRSELEMYTLKIVSECLEFIEQTPQERQLTNSPYDNGVKNGKYLAEILIKKKFGIQI